MIIYRHPRQAEGTPSVPPWLADAPDACLGESATHRLCGLGPDYLMGDRPGVPWVAVDDGWEAYHSLPNLPMLSARRLTWARSRLVADAAGAQWQVPVLLTPMGHPAVIAAYGEDWLPAYTPQQVRLIEVAKAAKTALENRELPEREACQWTAEILAAGHHLTVLVIQRLRLIDSFLVQHVLATASGLVDLAELTPVPTDEVHA